jgi:hypothetical protein
MSYCSWPGGHPGYLQTDSVLCECASVLDCFVIVTALRFFTMAPGMMMILVIILVATDDVLSDSSECQRSSEILDLSGSKYLKACIRFTR